MRLSGKNAIVTGAGSGFGAGIARKFAAEGARVMCADINADAARAVADEIGGIASTCDVGDGDSVNAMAQAALAAFGDLDILVNNAGITHLPGFMEDITEDDFDRVLRVNAKSVYLTARALVPAMKARRTGAILNIASTAGVSPRPRLNWYNASKGWMITATKAMAVELAPFGVRVNALNPVAGETPLLKSFMGEDTPEIRAKFLATIPLGRFSTPEDMGNAACFLCSDEASMVTGVALEVDGGRCVCGRTGGPAPRTPGDISGKKEPAMMRVGPRNALTDVAGLRVGHAQDARLKSGCTVVLGDVPFVASCHVMGGAPGTRETDLLAPDKSVQAVDALVLSGGSAFGLDACSGVMDRLAQAGRGFAVGAARVPIVPGAILFDLLNGGDKRWGENPYRGFGRAAFDAAHAGFAIGTVGAGTGAFCAMQKGGLGTASFVLECGVTVAALVVANPVGSATTPNGHFWAAPFEMGGEFGGLGPDPSAGLCFAPVSLKAQAMAAARGANTTPCIVATDARLTKAQCHRIAVSAHDGIARAVVPAHTPHDGDIVFALATGARPVDEDAMLRIGAAAAHCVARALARGVFAATPARGDILPTWRGRDDVSGKT